MPKKKDKSSEEYYRGLIRKLEKRVRDLEKELKYYSRREHHYEEIILREEDAELVEVTKKVLCMDCGKGELKKVLELSDRHIVECNLCHFRKSVKNNG